jgi:integrase/recombinase XerD
VLSTPGPHKLLRATSDSGAIADWLSGCCSNPNTLRAYAKESSRLLFWCETVAHKTLVDLAYEDIVSYSNFLKKPPARYIGPPRPRSNPAWRPLAGPLGPAAVAHALRILRGMMDWLVEAGHLPANPIALVRHKGTGGQPSKAASRAFPPEAMEAVRRWLAGLPETTSVGRFRKLRGVALTEVLIGAGLRRSEAAMARTSHLRVDRRGNFWLDVPHGKGDKPDKVVIRPETVQALLALYTAMGLPGTLSGIRHADFPLILSIRPMPPRELAKSDKAKPKGVSPDLIYSEIKWIVSNTAHLLKIEGELDLADLVTRASPHWFRHGFVTAMVEIAGIRVAQQQARHSRMDTTLIYDHQPDYDRADAVLGAEPGSPAPK